MAGKADEDHSLPREGGHLVYEPDGEVLRQFLEDRSHVSIIRGPIRSGTSSACCLKIYDYARQQPLFRGKRRSRWAIVRDSYPNLRSTTAKTWLKWFPDGEYRSE